MGCGAEPHVSILHDYGVEFSGYINLKRDCHSFYFVWVKGKKETGSPVRVEYYTPFSTFESRKKFFNWRKIVKI